MKIKIIRSLLTPILGVSAIGAIAAASTSCGGGKKSDADTFNSFTYTLNEDGETYEIGIDLSKIDINNFNEKIVIPSQHPEDHKNITVIGEDFLKDAISFNSPIILPDTILTIKSNFLNNCQAFNQPLDLPTNVTSFFAGFLCNCHSFNKPLWLHENIIHFERFLQNAYSFCQAIIVDFYPANKFSSDDRFVLASNKDACDLYKFGAKLLGPFAHEFAQMFQNSNKYPFRRLIISED